MRTFFLFLLLAMGLPLVAATPAVSITCASFVDKDELLSVSGSVADGMSLLNGHIIVVRNGDKPYEQDLASGLYAGSIEPSVSIGSYINVTTVYLGDSSYGAAASTIKNVLVTDLPDISAPSNRIYGPLTQVIRFTASSPLSHSISMSATANKSYVGSQTDNGNGTLDVSVVPLLGNVNETITFTVTATDTNTGCARVTAFPIKVWRLPVAVLDIYLTARNTPLTLSASVGLMVNDFGEDNSLDVVDEPNHGTLMWGHDGGFTYTPDNNWVGIDTFTYHLTDGAGYVTSTVLVTITTTL